MLARVLQLCVCSCGSHQHRKASPNRTSRLHFLTNRCTQSPVHDYTPLCTVCLTVLVLVFCVHVFVVPSFCCVIPCSDSVPHGLALFPPWIVLLMLYLDRSISRRYDPVQSGQKLIWCTVSALSSCVSVCTWHAGHISHSVVVLSIQALS